MPGVPDIYQGAELWEQSLVDPDNRRPVDFPLRGEMLARSPASMWDGGAKLALTRTLLGLRRARPQLFAEGSYEPLAASGPGAAAICAFARRRGEAVLVVAAALRHGADAGAEAVIRPPAATSGPWRDVLTGEAHPELAAPALFAALPVAVLVPADAADFHRRPDGGRFRQR